MESGTLESGVRTRAEQSEKAGVFMPILQSQADQSATRGVLLITGLGVLFGLFFGVPPALAVRAMGFTWMPYGVGVLGAGLIAGFFLAYLVVTFLLQTPMRTPLSSRLPERLAADIGNSLKPPKCTTNLLRRRLAEEKECLDRLDAERQCRRDSGLAKVAEERIVWGELLELELQDIDEQISRISRQAGRSDNYPREGDRHECNSQ